MTTGERISHIREKLRISRDELAKKLRISTVTLWRWETGKRQIKESSLRAIANELGVNISDLIEETGTKRDEKITLIDIQPNQASLDLKKELSFIGKKIKKIRQERGYSLEEISQKMNCSKEKIEGWEMGKIVPDIIELMLLRKVTGTSIAYMVGEKDDKTQKTLSDSNGDNIFFPYMTQEEILKNDGVFSIEENLNESGCYIRWERATDGDPSALIPEKWGFVPVDLHVRGLTQLGVPEDSDVAINPGLPIRSGDIVLAKFGDQLMIRRLLERQNSIDMTSDKDIIKITEEELNSGWFKILGRVAVVLAPISRF